MSKKLSIIMQFALTMSTVRAGWRCDITVGERRCHGVQVANATLTAAELAEHNLKRHQHQPFEPPDHVPQCIWDDAVEGYTGKYALESPDPKTSERCGNRTWSAYGGAACQEANRVGTVHNFGCDSACHEFPNGFESVQLEHSCKAKPTADQYYTGSCSGPRVDHARIWDRYLESCTASSGAIFDGNLTWMWHSAYIHYDC